MAADSIEQAQTWRRMVNAPHLVTLVCADVVFKKRATVENTQEQVEKIAAALKHRHESGYATVILT